MRTSSGRSATERSLKFLVCILAIAASACRISPPLIGALDAAETRSDFAVRGRRMTAHVSGRAGSDDPLVIYATGDGGWGGRDAELFKEIASLGYPTIGISSPQLLEGYDTGGHQASVADVGRDFGIVAAEGRRSLSPRRSRVILVGVSRGADLVIAAAADTALRRQLSGVVAIALTAEEEFVTALPGSKRTDMLDIYETLPRLGRLPVSVIQSTNDGYVPAATARTLFGADTPRRRLVPIDAQDHNFGNARPAMYSALSDCLAWIETLRGAARRTPRPVNQP